jgi:hypothetical protein
VERKWPAPIIVLALTGSLSAQLYANPITKAFNQCKTIEDKDQRLSCYDSLVIEDLMVSNEPQFSGKHTLKTELFTLTGPTQIRFQSDGSIFVMAIYNEEGDVVENLHIGGGGEDSYVLEQPGRYYLQVNGSTTWRVWLEPPPA